MDELPKSPKACFPPADDHQQNLSHHLQLPVTYSYPFSPNPTFSLSPSSLLRSKVHLSLLCLLLQGCGGGQKMEERGAEGSQIHRIFWVGRDSQGSLSPTVKQISCTGTAPRAWVLSVPCCDPLSQSQGQDPLALPAMRLLILGCVPGAHATALAEMLTEIADRPARPPWEPPAARGWGGAL